VVANWEGQLDKQRMRDVLDGKPVTPPEEPATPEPAEVEPARS
jgi:aerobic C4-dicarboxylate transport protein